MAVYLTIETNGLANKTCRVNFDNDCLNLAKERCTGEIMGYSLVFSVCDTWRCQSLWKVECDDEYGITTIYVSCEANSLECSQW